MASDEVWQRSVEDWRKVIEDARNRLPSEFPTYPVPARGSVEFAKLIDHTLLKPEATQEQILSICDEAKNYKFKAVCVEGKWAHEVCDALKNSGIDVACVVDFPKGDGTTENRVSETKRAVASGAKEIDIVINHRDLLCYNDTIYPRILSDLADVRKACPAPVIMKVILETSQLQIHHLVAASVLAISAGADFIKTSTGFLGRGASVEDVQIMRHLAQDPEVLKLRPAEYRSLPVKVKASGGIRTADDVVKMVTAGAGRIGASAGVAIMNDGKASEQSKESY